MAPHEPNLPGAQSPLRRRRSSPMGLPSGGFLQTMPRAHCVSGFLWSQGCVEELGFALLGGRATRFEVPE